MKEDRTILPFRQLEKIDDPLTEIAREGARRMLAEMLKAEADAFVAKFGDERLEDGRPRVVRHGLGPERQIQTGIGPLDVQRPKVRDRAATDTPDTKIRFTSNILPKRARRLVSLDALLPVLYARGDQDAAPALRDRMIPNRPHHAVASFAMELEPVAHHGSPIAAARLHARPDLWPLARHSLREPSQAVSPHA